MEDKDMENITEPEQEEVVQQDYFIGQTFDFAYPPEAAFWCNGNNAIIEEKHREEEIEGEVVDVLYYEISAIPEPSAPTKEEQSKKREAAYIAETDPIQTHIDRLKDGEQTPETIAEIEQLRIERDEKIVAIKERYPYPTDPII